MMKLIEEEGASPTLTLPVLRPESLGSLRAGNLRRHICVRVKLLMDKHKGYYSSGHRDPGYT
jgi:hypothetical protein